MEKNRRVFVLGSMLAAGLPALTVRAQATWPSRPITYIVPYAAGGTTDILGRVLSAQTGPLLGTTVVVVNRAGAGGTIGAAAIAQAAADGYTIGGGSIADQAISPNLYDKTPYDTLKDFTPITLIGTMPNLLIVNANTPYRSIKDLVEAARAKPGTLSYASAGSGTSQHLSTELFRMMANIDVIHVPYKGAGPALQAVLAGETPFSFENSAVAAPHIHGGRIRALAVSSAQRLADWPDLPTVAAAGYPGYEVTSWQAIFGPAGLPPSLVQRLNAVYVASLKHPDTIARFSKIGMQVAASSPAELAEFKRAEVEKWGKVIKAGNIKAS